MIFCDTASGKADAFDDLVVFLHQLHTAGIPARTGFGSVTDGIGRNHQFDVAPFLGHDRLEPGETLLMIGAHELDDAKLVALRRTGVDTSTLAYAIGSFTTPQARIGTTAKLSYVLGQDPVVHTLTGPVDTTPTRCPLLGVATPRTPRERPTVLVIAPNLTDVHEARSLLSLAVSRAFRILILTDGKSKQAWHATHGTTIPVYHYAESLPASLAALVDVCVTFAKPSKNYRMQSLLANIAAQGGALIDCTHSHAHTLLHDVFIAGPRDLGALGPFLTGTILPVLDTIAHEVRASSFVHATQPSQALAFLGAKLPQPALHTQPKTTAPHVVFVPTNGIGLGHAQRTSLIANAMDPAQRPVFAAFPSCMQMLHNYGFDAMPLVGRSPLHAQEHENDLVNYNRLRALTRGASTLVFDGGYVFDSITRSIQDNNLRGVWIRRGLWQGTQDNSIALDREKVFQRVIVPLEAFDELNQRYSRGSHLHEVGPIVQRTVLSPEERATLRARLTQRTGVTFDKLVVTMLGGGVAADRKAQLAAICAMMERRPNTLNLIVVWPTATVEAGWFSWRNTRVVQTHHASALVAAADLFVTATGYNSFHEAVYNQVPAIFVPQMAAMMDDQRARAMAAVERGCASIVEPHEMLTLQTLVRAHLDEGHDEIVRTNLAALTLPEPGNAHAARIIEELTR